MSQRRRIYLDNAATSWPKPEQVYAQIDHYLRQVGAPAGRGSYDEAVWVDRSIAATRRGVAKLLGTEAVDHVVFTPGCTDSLNTAIHGLLRPQDHVVTTVIEHNSVLRPLRTLEDKGVIQVTRVACDAAGVVDPGEVARGMTDKTRLIVVSHASNVTGALQPADEISKVARQHGAILLLDAAQTLGHVPFDVDAMGADVVAASGHKGLLGPLGIGVMYVRPGIETQLASLRQGGTGSQSHLDQQPETLPEKYESGSPNVPGIIGLGAAVEYLLERGVAEIAAHEHECATALLNGLGGIDGVELYGPRTGQRVGVVSVNLRDYDPRELAAVLDSHYGVCVRSGIHCAPLMHTSLGTLKRGGTVRFSVGPFTTATDIEWTIQAIGEIAAAALPA